MDCKAVTPPRPPTDLIASALHLPLSGINTSHRDRKLRFVGQVLAFQPKASLLLLTCPGPVKPFPTILVNISIPLLGSSTAVESLYTTSTSSGSHGSGIGTVKRNLMGSDDEDENLGRTGTRGSLINREKVRLDRGEWVCVVGWLEGDDPRLLKKIVPPPSYAAPLPIVIEVIHLSPARQPPVDAYYPSIGVSGHDSQTRRRSTRRKSTNKTPYKKSEDKDATPRPRPKR